MSEYTETIIFKTTKALTLTLEDMIKSFDMDSNDKNKLITKLITVGLQKLYIDLHYQHLSPELREFITSAPMTDEGINLNPDTVPEHLRDEFNQMFKEVNK